MAGTTIPFGSAQAAKVFGGGLFVYQQKQLNVMRNMVGPMTSESMAAAKVEKQQTGAGYPIVEVLQLTKTAGDRVQVDMLNVKYAPPIMGDKEAEGKGRALTFDSMEIGLDQWTFPVSAGGKMSQQRSPYQLRALAMASAKGHVEAYDCISSLVHMAGQRGTETGGQWDTVPLASDDDYASIIVNTFDGTDVTPPTENRYFVTDGTTILSGSDAITQLAAFSTADTLKLDHLDQIRNVIDALVFGMQPIKVPDDPMASDDPVFMALTPSPAYSGILTDGALRQFQQYGLERARYNQSGKSPLFSGVVGAWNGILTKKMSNYVSFGNGDVIRTLKADGTVRSTTVANLPTGYRIYRVIILGAQAMARAYGADTSSGSPYSWAEKKHDFDRKPEFAVFGISANKKVTFSVPDATGAKIPTDFGTIILDVIGKVPAGN